TSRFTLELQAGVITVELEQEADSTLIRMAQREPVFGEIYTRDLIAPIFGLEPEDILPDVPVQTVSTGTPQLMIPVHNLEALRRVQLNIPLYQSLRERGDFFSPHVFCRGSVTPDGDTFARHFGVPPDTSEDPFTGSATGGMGAYLWRYDLIPAPTFVADQGHWMGRPGRAVVNVIGAPNAIEIVKVGGYAVRVMSGEMLL
ncbi:MAG: PhzF family phenazine biosynthesis protein, partial [Anaerolineae bacterium]|nr:PhzF family phenazine biosynthesis protein [Anaerolineae bacterium]